MPPVFADQAVQREAPAASLTKLNSCCPRSLSTPAVRPASGCWQLCGALNNCLLYVLDLHSVWMQTLCHWTSASEPLMRPTNKQIKKECNCLSFSGLDFLLCHKSASTHTLKCLEMNGHPDFQPCWREASEVRMMLLLSELDWDFCFDGLSTVYSGVRKDAVTEIIIQQQLKQNILKKIKYFLWWMTLLIMLEQPNLPKKS